MRGYQTIRRKKGVLISADDFEQYAIEVLGMGQSPALCRY
jgi:hypothetical protein